MLGAEYVTFSAPLRHAVSNELHNKELFGLGFV